MPITGIPTQRLPSVIPVPRAEVVWPANAIVVAQTGGDYSTIAAGLAAASAGDVVVVYPGTYAESITIPDDVDLVGSGGIILISGALATGTRVTLGDRCFLRNVEVQTPSDATPAIYYAGATIAQIETIVAHGDAGNGYFLEMAGTGEMRVADCVYRDGASSAFALLSSTGDLHLHRTIIRGGTLTELIEVSAAGSIHVDNLEIWTGAVITDGLYASAAGARIRLHNVDLNHVPTNAVHIGADGVDIFVTASSLFGATYDWLVDPALTGVATVLTVASSSMRTERLSFPAAFQVSASISAAFADTGINNDRASRFISELAVGMPGLPKEASFGEGDSTTDGMVVYSVDDYSAPVVWVDNTVAARSASASSFGLFQGTAIGGAAYIGEISPRMFYGVKVDMDTAGVTGSAVYVWEYWSGAAWTAFDMMASDADSPYDSHATDQFTRTTNDQIRFDASNFAGWATTAVNGTTAYWVRVRISGAVLTTVPVLERVKLHTKRTEINKDGLIEHFGPEQPHIDLGVRLANGFANSGGAAPTSNTLSISANNTVVIPASAFASGDAKSWLINIPDGLDTSRDIVFTVGWAPSDANAGTVIWYTNVATPITVGTQIDAGTIPEVQATTTATVVIATQGLLKEDTLIFRLPNQLPGRSVMLGLKRIGGSYGGRAEVLYVSCEGTRWK